MEKKSALLKNIWSFRKKKFAINFAKTIANYQMMWYNEDAQDCFGYLTRENGVNNMNIGKNNLFNLVQSHASHRLYIRGGQSKRI